MVLDTRERRRKLLEVLWETAVHRAPQDDAAGLPPDAIEAWEIFENLIEELGCELVLQPLEDDDRRSVEERVAGLRSVES